MIESTIIPWQERAEFYGNALGEAASPTFWLDPSPHPRKGYFEWKVMRVGDEMKQVGIVWLDKDHILAMNGISDDARHKYLLDTFKPCFDQLRHDLELG